MTHDRCKSAFKGRAAAAPNAGTGLAAWRNVLATGVASAAMFAYSGRPVSAQTFPPAAPCNQISGGGTTVTCSGNVSTGVNLSNAGGPYTTLNVNNLTTDIAPANGVTGIQFTSNGPIEVNVDPGPFQIFATDADGIFAASNNGTVTITSTADVSTTGSGAVGIQASGQNELVTITSSGDIITTGNNSFGIAAGTVYGDIVINSSGGISTAGTFAAGINAGTIGQPSTIRGAITINSSGDIVTAGNSAAGITAASVYGPIDITSLGNMSITGTSAGGIGASTNGDITIDAQGNIASTASAIRASTPAGAVSITSSGNLSTTENSSSAIAVLTDSGDVLVNSTSNMSTAGFSASGIKVSNQGVSGTDAGAITITSSGDITTTNGRAYGILASSDYAPIDIVSSGKITTSGLYARGIHAETGSDIAIASLGDIATSDNGAAAIWASSTSGDIAVLASGDITTAGSLSHGIEAASTSGAIGIMSFGDITVSGAGSMGITAETQGNVAIASAGNISTGDGSSVAISALSQLGSVTIASTGDIATEGDNAAGIYAAGGITALVYASGSIVTRGDYAAGIAAAGPDGAIVVSSSSIRTYGDDAPGIAVMSDGDAAVVSRGDITTTGIASDGISVISNSGTATVVNAGHISATGMGSAGIYAASYSGTRVINLGAITGCPCGGVILRTYDGDNSLVNFGAILADVDGSAIEMDTTIGGSNLVENFGTVSGSVLMAGVSSMFINNAGALFNSGDAVIADVTNEGTLAPGGKGTIETTTMSGSLLQSRSGILAVDLSGASSDSIVDATRADLAGQVAVTVISLPIAQALVHTLVSTSAGAFDDGLSLSASPALHAQLRFTGLDVLLGVAVDFEIDGLNNNQRALAGSLNSIFGAGGGAVTPVLLGLLNVDSAETYRSALNQLSPEIYSDAQIAALYSNLAFTGSLMSCKVNGTDTASIIREGQCLWAGASARFLDTGTTFQQIGFTETAGLFTAGAQVALDDVWRLGIAGGYQSSTMSNATGASSEGNLGQAGMALKYNPGQLLLAGAITGGGAQYETRRVMSFGGFSDTAEGTQNLGFFSAGMRAAYVFGSPGLYVKPSVDANLTYLSMSDFTESSASGSGYAVSGQNQTVVSVAPMVETGTEFWLGNGTLVRPIVRGGAVWYGNSDMALTAAFANAPLLSDGSGVGGFTIHTDMDEVMGIVGAGIDVISGTDAVLRFSYDAQLGQTTQIQAVGIKGSTRF